MALLQEAALNVQRFREEAEARGETEQISAQMFAESKRLLDEYGKPVRRVGVQHTFRLFNNVLEYGAERPENNTLMVKLNVNDEAVSVTINDRWSLRGQKKGLRINVIVDGLDSYLQLQGENASIIKFSGGKQNATYDQLKDYNELIGQVGEDLGHLIRVG